jgi:hypothetical protein
MIRPIMAIALVALLARPGIASPVVSKRDDGLPSSGLPSGLGASVPKLGAVTDILRDVPELGALIPPSDEQPVVLKERQISGGSQGDISRRGILGIPADISLPPVIPSIPGVTGPLASNAPPLPILQVPSPPLDSPPFQGSNIKPKKIGYFWTGAGDNQHKDFLVTASLDDVSLPSGNVDRCQLIQDTFGTILTVTDVPSSGNSPHHLGPTLDGKTLVGGGLLSLLKTQDTAYYFDVSNPYAPKFLKSNRGLLGSITDEIRAKPDG